jgi:hypothetical protein
MKSSIVLALTVLAAFSGCTKKEAQMPIIGTWELVSATTIEKDTSFSTFDPAHKMIKIINPTHFAFLNHSLNRAKDSSATAFNAGGGSYMLADSTYTEHLDYFTDKEWEGHTFEFVVKFSGDTLIQKGVEKVEKLGIDRIIIEKYKKVTQ